MADARFYNTNQHRSQRIFNRWDALAILIIFSVIGMIAIGATHASTPYKFGQEIPISLDPHILPFYAVRTVLRMAIALFFSLLFTFSVGALAAKNKRARRIILPLIDILQSVPVLSFLSITIVGFIMLFPNSILGPECASIFAIFTAQAWNMTLGFYQTLRAVPQELREAADIYHLNAWQRFWRIEVPFSLSGLLWNTMISISASWFFVVASEALSVSGQNIRLPGIGSYIALAIENSNMQAVCYAITAMLIVILIYDQLLFRPLIQWSEKFTIDDNPREFYPQSWFVNLLQKTHFLLLAGDVFARVTDRFINLSFTSKRSRTVKREVRIKRPFRFAWLFDAAFIGALTVSAVILFQFITSQISSKEIFHVFLLGFATSARVIVLIALASIIWVPIGVLIGTRPSLALTVQSVVQFLASFPANLFFPIVVIVIVRYHLNPEIWTAPLMILGSQWYILFNVIAGALSLPKDLYQAADNFGLRGWNWWRRFALPGIFPFYITGAITAAGGAWNASIVAEWISWGHTTVRATGLGEYITAYTNTGDFPRIALGTSMMCIFVLAFNRVLWRPLYHLAQARFNLD